MLPDRRFVIFIPEPFPDEVLRDFGDDFEIRQGRAGAPYSELEFDEILRDVNAIVITSRERITAQVIERASELRVITKSGARPSNVDFAAARRRSVHVLWTPGANVVSVAEMTMTLIFATTKRLSEMSDLIRRGSWRSYHVLGREIAGMTLGLVGLGAIGRAVATRFRAFQGHLLGFDPNLSDDDVRMMGVEPVELRDLLRRADIVSLHCELNSQTRQLINRTTLAEMKHGAILINTARGGLVEEEALLRALDDGTISAAGLDVFADEPVRQGHVLISHPRVVATPHVAAFTREAIIRETTWALEDTARVLCGLVPLHSPSDSAHRFSADIGSKGQERPCA